MHKDHHESSGGIGLGSSTWKALEADSLPHAFAAFASALRVELVAHYAVYGSLCLGHLGALDFAEERWGRF